ncbi:MAG: L-histidine N(alpha)-methyltransferase [Oligoflexia bacterium]|nr:L-histidine N(alpha)-methyltransferase [Oligoflexia bacterium]
MTSPKFQNLDFDFIDLKPETDQFKRDVIAGLSKTDKSIPPKYFYDEKGSDLFDQICQLEEYYVTRSEIEILQAHAKTIAAAIGDDCLIYEFGSGSGEKTRILLDAIRNPAGYLPIEISRESLLKSSERLAYRYPHIPIVAICADFTKFMGDLTRNRDKKRALFFPGSTLGNFDPSTALQVLKNASALLGEGGYAVVGIDLLKDPRILERAYNDSIGVTAAFNLNLLHRINRDLNASFRVERFRHRAFFNERHCRIEMHLESSRDQWVDIDNETFSFARNETIHTENSYKYTSEAFRSLSCAAGMTTIDEWRDRGGNFSVFLLRTY